MYDLHAYLRKTWKYRDGWAGQDDWTFIQTVRLTPAVQVREPRDYDDGGSWVQYARLPAGTSRKRKAEIIRAIQHTVSGNSCQHEHDCCGCAMHYATVKSISRRDLIIHTNVAYNY